MGTIFGDIRFLRGLEENLPSLEEGQPAFTEDTKRVFIGSDAGNVELAKQESVDTIEGRLDGLDQRSKNVWMDVKKDFEAKGDGITDDIISIQNAFNYARDNGSVKLYFPEGTYCISNSIQAYKNTTVEWHPNAVIKRIGTYYKMFVNGDPTNESYVLDGGYSGEGNIHFYGGTFDMNCQVGNTSGISPTQTVTFFDLGHAENISFNNITVKNGQSGHYFQVSSCKNVRFKDCWFGDINYTGDGTNYAYECIQIEVATSETFPDFGNYDLTISRDIYIEGCTFDVIRAIGTHGDALYDTATTIFCENLNIIGNTFDTSVEDMLHLTGEKYVNIQNNLILNAGGYGMNLYKVEDSKIEGNTILTPQKSGFYINTTNNNKFSKNIVKDCSQAGTFSGFRLTTSNGNIFDGDTVTGSPVEYSHAWYIDTSDTANPNRIISHNFTKGTSGTIGGATSTDVSTYQLGGGQTVLFDGDISALTTPGNLTNDIRNFNYIVVMANGNSGSASMTSIIIPKAAILFGVTTSRFRLLTADSSTSAQLDFSFPTTTSIQMDTNPSGTSHIRKVIGII
jgi:hypothetical protein